MEKGCDTLETDNEDDATNEETREVGNTRQPMVNIL